MCIKLIAFYPSYYYYYLFFFPVDGVGMLNTSLLRCHNCRFYAYFCWLKVCNSQSELFQLVQHSQYDRIPQELKWKGRRSS